jgi:hypothetical protein
LALSTEGTFRLTKSVPRGIYRKEQVGISITHPPVALSANASWPIAALLLQQSI